MKHAIKISRGFTLVELLVVMGIIALLMCLLVPTITKAIEVVKKDRTLNEFKELGISIQSFRNDWGDIPPSKPYNVADSTTGAMLTGAANLAYYLLGPGVCVPGGIGGGWGTSGGGAVPFGTAAIKPTRAYGSYYQVESGDLGYEKKTDGTTVLSGFLDGFKGGYWDMGGGRSVPRGLILYWKYDAAASTQSTNYNVVENGPLGAGLANYADQAKLTEAVVMSAYVGIRVDLSDLTKWHWPRDDYLLASPGPDGRFGYTKTNSDGTIGPALSGDAGATCDDIFN